MHAVHVLSAWTSFTVVTSGANVVEKPIILTNSNFITFDSGKCGYYNAASKKWTEDGTACTFTHLTVFTASDECFMRLP